MRLEEHKIDIHGLAINYVEGGSGRPIIFLHNGGGFWHSWEHQIKHFVHAYKVYGIDWPGFGESDAPKGPFSLDLLTETLSEFIRIKGLKDVLLIGNCVGGSAALFFSMQRPEMVSKLIIFNICPGDLIFRLKPMRKLIYQLNSKPKAKAMFSSILVYGFTKTFFKRKFPRVLFGKQVDKGSPLFLRYLEKIKLQSQTDSRVNMVFSVHSFNLIKYLIPERVPKHLLVWGEHNQVTSLENHGHYHYNLLNSAQFEVVKNAGHLCMYEQPESTNSIIEAYLTSSD